MDITTDRLVVRITDAKDGSEELYKIALQLHAPVDPAQSRWTLLSTKVCGFVVQMVVCCVDGCVVWMVCVMWK